MSPPGVHTFTPDFASLAENPRLRTGWSGGPFRVWARDHSGHTPTSCTGHICFTLLGVHARPQPLMAPLRPGDGQWPVSPVLRPPASGLMSPVLPTPLGSPCSPDCQAGDTSCLGLPRPLQTVPKHPGTLCMLSLLLPHTSQHHAGYPRQLMFIPAQGAPAPVLSPLRPPLPSDSTCPHLAPESLCPHTPAHGRGSGPGQGMTHSDCCRAQLWGGCGGGERGSSGRTFWTW